MQPTLFSKQLYAFLQQIIEESYLAFKNYKRLVLEEECFKKLGGVTMMNFPSVELEIIEGKTESYLIDVEKVDWPKGLSKYEVLKFLECWEKDGFILKLDLKSLMNTIEQKTFEDFSWKQLNNRFPSNMVQLHELCTAYVNHVLTNHEGFQSNAELKRKLSEYKKMDEMSVNLIADYERKLAALQEEVKQLKISKAIAISDMNFHKERNEGIVERVNSLQVAYDKLKSESHDLQQQLAESKTELGIAHIEVDRLKRLLESCEAALEDRNEQLDNSHLAEQSLQQQLTDARKEIEELKAKFASELRFQQWYQEAGFAKIGGDDGITKDTDLFVNVNDPSREPYTAQSLYNLYGEDNE